MDVEKVSKTILSACDKIADIEITGIKLECASASLLDVRDGNFNEHVAIQPAAIAYYGVLKKTAYRQLESAKEDYDRWKKKKFHDAKLILEQEKKRPTISDIEAHVIINNESDIKNIENKISELQEQYDTLECWYDAWKQKSWSLKEHGATLNSERYTMPYMNNDDDDEKIRRYQKGG